MKKFFTNFIFIMLFVSILFAGCTIASNSRETEEQITKNSNEAENFSQSEPVSMPVTASRWTETTHSSITEVCAWQWGISTNRKTNMEEASEMPDTYQSGLDNGFNQQWSHAYLYNSWGIWVWGDADDDFHDNIDGDSGEWESPEGYNGKSASYYYGKNDQKNGDWYLGYACHYIEDVSLMLHSSFPDIEMLYYHFSFEEWVENNLTEGHNFLDEVVNDRSYYPITDLKEGIRTAAYNSSYGNSEVGKKVWDNYEASGYPTGTGTGNSDLVYYTKLMIKDAGRYTKGAIKYTLDKYDQWDPEY